MIGVLLPTVTSFFDITSQHTLHSTAVTKHYMIWFGLILVPPGCMVLVLVLVLVRAASLLRSAHSTLYEQLNSYRAVSMNTSY
jgi:hypothetical protein